jgi:DNA-binding MarR family transcriptional regulator
VDDIEDQLTDREGFGAFLTLVHLYQRLLSTLERETQAAGHLTLSSYETLAVLTHAPDGRLRMQDLAAAVVTSKSGATRTVASLEAQGYVERVIPPENRRVTYAVVTDAGRAAWRDAAPGFFARVHEHFGRHLNPGDAQLLQKLLHRISTGLDPGSTPPEPSGWPAALDTGGFERDRPA